MVCLPNPFKSLLFLIAIFASTTFSSKNITIHEDKVVFGAGCFWSVEKKFAELSGVINVESGYADGIGLEPKYTEITENQKINLILIILLRLSRLHMIGIQFL